MTRYNDTEFVNPEDLLNILNLKINELLSHIKLLANSTGLDRDFDITESDMNAIAGTLHDRTVDILLTTSKLKNALFKA